MGTRIIPPFERFVSKIKINIATGCWEWQGSLSKGYGLFRISPRQSINAHRFAYISLVGPIPEGYELDHYLVPRNKCSRKCCCPDHLVLATSKENNNNRRNNYLVRGECSHGHAMTADNAYTDKKTGNIKCKTCCLQRAKRRYENNRERLLAYQQEYKQTHREAKAESARAYRDKNREKILQYLRDYKKRAQS